MKTYLKKHHPSMDNYLKAQREKTEGLVEICCCCRDDHTCPFHAWILDNPVTPEENPYKLKESNK